MLQRKKNKLRKQIKNIIKNYSLKDIKENFVKLWREKLRKFLYSRQNKT